MGEGHECSVSLLTGGGISMGSFLETLGFSHGWDGTFEDPPAHSHPSDTEDSNYQNQNDHSHTCSSQSRLTLLLLIFFTCSLLQSKPTLEDHHWPGNTAF